MYLVSDRDQEARTVTMTAALERTGHVTTSDLADGKLVQLAGAVGEPELDPLRRAFLMPLAGHCRDIVVDGGAITEITDDAVAILLAACTWAQQHGARFLISRSSETLDDVLDELGVYDELPRLSQLAAHSGPDAVVAELPRPRSVRD
jgi:anti-anti-sigma regulatory factor